MKNNISYLCPRCGHKLSLFAIASQIDTDGSKFGAILTCSSCGWNDWGHFIEKRDLHEIAAVHMEGDK